MPNLDAAYGLRPTRHLTGGCLRTNKYTIASAHPVNIFTGDPVELVAAGVIQESAAGSNTSIGVFWGCKYVYGAGNQVFSKHWPANTVATEIEAFVYDDPDVIWQVQGNATGLTAADVGGLADWVVVAGDTSVGRSKSVISNVVGATGGLRILRLVEDGENESGAFTDVEVVMAEHAFNTTGGGV